jgi:enamine deaminase RidA (YjgF/YER057c/UK114 family)
MSTLLRRWPQTVLLFLAAIALLLGLTLARPAQAELPPIVRHPIPDSTFPIAQAVEIPTDGTLVYLSGQVPAVIAPDADPTSIEAFGDTEAQTITVLEKIDDILTSIDLTMADVVKMQAFLVGDPELDGSMDFPGFMDGYTQFFGTEDQPNLPARSTMQISGLVNPGWLVEIEVVAVRR